MKRHSRQDTAAATSINSNRYILAVSVGVIPLFKEPKLIQFWFYKVMEKKQDIHNIKIFDLPATVDYHDLPVFIIPI